MIIDSHQHPVPEVPGIMAQYGIDVSVLLPVGPGAFDKARVMLQRAPEKYVTFYWIDINDISQSLIELESAVREVGVRGIKFQPLLQHFWADERRLYPVYEKCIDLDLAVLFHTGAVAFYQEYGIPHLTQYSHPMPIDQVAYDFPALSVILAHLGGNYFYETMILAEKHDNIYLDTAYLPFFCRRLLPDITPIQMINRAAEIVGPERILYGCEGLSPEVIQDSVLSTDAKRAILGGNAARLLKIPVH
jgi:predicted TIM-barrel fold metal-dependent hydrolase